MSAFWTGFWEFAKDHELVALAMVWCLSWCIVESSKAVFKMVKLERKVHIQKTIEPPPVTKPTLWERIGEDDEPKESK